MRPKSVAMTVDRAHHFVFPTKTCVVDRPTNVEMVLFGPGGPIRSVGLAPLV